MPINLYPSVAKAKRNGAWQNLPGFVQQSGDADIEAMIANKETSTTAQFAHAKDSFFILNDVLYQADANININDTIADGTNCHVSVMGEEVSELIGEVYSQSDDIDGLKTSVATLNNTNDKVITPRFFAENLNGLLGDHIPATYKDGYYISNGNAEMPLATTSIQSIEVTPGVTYRIKPYSTMNSNANYGLYYDANGDMIGSIKNGAVLVEGTEREYNATAPITAHYMKINVLVNDKQEVREVYLGNDVELPTWLNTNESIYLSHHRESINKPFSFSGGSGTYLGDSIAYGTCSPNLGTTTSYLKLFGNAVNCTILRAAIAGSKFADPDNANSILNKCLTMSTDNVFYFISGGINDFIFGSPLGSYGSTDTSTFYGALNAVCSHFANDLPNSTVIFITPLPLTKAYFITHPNLISVNAEGHTLDEYRDAIYKVATKYKLNVVDGSTLGFPTSIEMGGWANEMCDDSDGCHPTIAGHELLARNLKLKLC